MVNISTAIRGHYGNDGYLWAIIIRRFYDSPSSTLPRPSLDPPPVNREERPTWHRTRGLFTVSSSTSPWCSGMTGHSRGTSLQPPPQRSTKLHLKGTPGAPASSYPIKGQAGALQGGQTNNEQQTTKNQSPSHQRRPTSQAISFVISLSFDTWARFPLSQLVTPTQALRCKEIQYSLLPAGRRAFFCLNQDKSPCILLASPSSLGTHNI
jgi:hypothetical protein